MTITPNTATNSTRLLVLFGFAFTTIYLLVLFVSWIAFDNYTLFHVLNPQKAIFEMALPGSVTVFIMVGLALLYGGFVFFIWRRGVSEHERDIIVRFLFLFMLILLLSFPIFSSDIIEYILTGKSVVEYHVDPYVVPASSVVPEATEWGGWSYLPSAYGPFWNIISAILIRLHTAIPVQLFVIRLFLSVMLWGSIMLIYLIVKRIRSQVALQALALVSWNPLLLLESVANGHHDILMVFAVLLSLWLMTHRRFTLALVALTVGIAIKYIPIVLIPIWIAYIVHTRLPWQQILRIGMAAGLIVIVLFLIISIQFDFGAIRLSIQEHDQSFGLDYFRGG